MKRLWPLLVLLAACGSDDPPEERKTHAPRVLPKGRGGPPAGQPTRVLFDHIVISFQGADANIEAYRPRDAARRLAYELLEKVESGMDWDQLKQQFSDDRAKAGNKTANGPYRIVNEGLRYQPSEIPRAHYGKDLGDALFTMKVGDVRIVDYEPKDCPSGWHILKRLE